MSQGTRLPGKFSWLNYTQFFGALNDNYFNLVLTFYLLDNATTAKSTTMALVGAVFVLPFILFSNLAGVYADKLSKRDIIVKAKFAEMLIMGLGVFCMSVGWSSGLYFVLFCMTTQSAFFGPSKYGIIPELLEKTQLSKGNSRIVLYTFMAIILGTVGSSVLAEDLAWSYPVLGLVSVCIAFLGWTTSKCIPDTGANGVDSVVSVNFVKENWRVFHAIKDDGYLVQAVLATTFFWFVGAYTKLNLIPYGQEVLGISEKSAPFLFLWVAAGIGLGAALGGKLSGRNIEFGIVPIGAGAMSVGFLGLSLVGQSVLMAQICFMILGLGAGLFIIPLSSFIQWRAPSDQRGRILAMDHWLSNIGMLGAAFFMYAIHADSIFAFNAKEGFAVLSFATLVMLLVTIVILPDFLMRFVVLVITRCFYKLRIKGIENVPAEGGALLVCNHVSWVDALLIMASQQRRVRFMIYRGTYNWTWANWFFRIMQMIPVSYTDSPKKILGSLQEARQALDDGYIVCIFAEGHISRTGNPMAFKKGMHRIVKGSDHPVVPVYIGGAWGSITSYFHGEPFRNWPAKLPYPVSLQFGESMTSVKDPQVVRQTIMQMAGEYYQDRIGDSTGLGHRFIESARLHWGNDAMVDSTGKRLSYGESLIGALAFADVLRPMTEGQQRVGVLLPSGVGGALVNIALTLLGKTAVNLNFTASADAFQSAIDQCELKTIVSAKAFLEKLEGVDAPAGTVYLEDIKPDLSPVDKLKYAAIARCCPVSMMPGVSLRGGNDCATIIFSSGSTAEPKGVMLSHQNVLSNVEGVCQVFRATVEDNVVAALPFFHSFGYTATLWFPLTSGLKSTFHNNPMDGGVIAELAREEKGTILLATPTFLLAYWRKAKPEDFASLRLVVTGAEKLKPKVADKFEKKFGVRPLEGYGATELSPVVSFNVPNATVQGIEQIGNKPGTVGHPLPGITMKVVDPESYELKGLNQEGLLLVKGPNVMLGYLNQPQKTAEAIQDGWYVTGDMATMDEDGFVTITDRLARFSKIGGEMVPHLALEEVYLEQLNTTDTVVVVTSVPDEKKGEKLVVLYSEAAGDAESLNAMMEASEVPNIWKPRKDAYYQVEEFPLLGTGKLDIKGIRAMALEVSDSKS